MSHDVEINNNVALKRRPGPYCDVLKVWCKASLWYTLCKPQVGAANITKIASNAERKRVRLQMRRIIAILRSATLRSNH